MIKSVNDISQLSAERLANFILQNYGPMSQLKLQKLLYYSEGYHLAYFDKALLHEDFEAWMHGPVCPEVYQLLKKYSLLYSDVKYVGKMDTKKDIQETLTSSQFEILTMVLNDLSTWTGTELEDATHKEKPWLEARVGYAEADSCNIVISKETMQEYYKAAFRNG